MKDGFLCGRSTLDTTGTHTEHWMMSNRRQDNFDKPGFFMPISGVVYDEFSAVESRIILNCFRFSSTNEGSFDFFCGRSKKIFGSKRRLRRAI